MTIDWTKSPAMVRVGAHNAAYHVHPDILTRESPVWDARLAGSWKASTSPLDWTDYEEDTIKYALEFFYTRRYSIKISRVDDRESYSQMEEPLCSDDGVQQPDELSQQLVKIPHEHPLQIHASVYGFASQYMCGDLQKAALSHIDEVLAADPSPLSVMLDAARQVYDRTCRRTVEPDMGRQALSRAIASRLRVEGDEADSLDLDNWDLAKDLIMEAIRRYEKESQEHAETAARAYRFQELNDQLEQSRCKKCRMHKTNAAAKYV